MRTNVPPPPLRRFDAGYDCELPEDVRRQFGAPKRARILRPLDPPQKRSFINAAVLGLCGLFFVVACSAVVSWFGNKHESRPAAVPVVVQPAPAPAPAATPSGVVPVPAPRAVLVKLPPPRAKLVWKIDDSHIVTMPYGMQVRATLRGFLGAENQLPRVGRIGDMWLVGDVPWIWIQVPGTVAATWIDP
jgi:hypothetical protein